MDVCRICLSPAIHQMFSQIKSKADGSLKFGVQIVTFCLDLEPVKDKHQVCIKCYKKIISFYKFKLKALRNNVYFQSNNTVQNEKYQNDKLFVKDEISIKIEDETNSGNDEDGASIISENDNYLKEDKLSSYIGDVDGEFDKSDDDPLDYIKRIKPPVEENKDVQPIKRKRGRPKIKDKLVTKKESQVCEECGKVVMNLRAHMVSHMSMLDRKALPCNMCTKVFSTSAARQRHIKIKHLGFRKHCDICNKDIINLQAHILTAHRRDQLKHKCLLCVRKFHCSSKLEEHMRFHTNTRPYECDHCGKNFRIKLSLTSHIQIVHQNLKTHFCQVCSKGFYKESKLRQHSRTHTKEKPFPCKVCGKFFRTTGQRNIHELRHSQIKNFLCEFCDMSFITSGDRTKHMVSHTKERRYQCSYCGDRFTRSDHKKRHEKTAHEKIH